MKISKKNPLATLAKRSGFQKKIILDRKIEEKVQCFYHFSNTPLKMIVFHLKTLTSFESLGRYFKESVEGALEFKNLEF